MDPVGLEPSHRPTDEILTPREIIGEGGDFPVNTVNIFHQLSRYGYRFPVGRIEEDVTQSF